MMEHTSTTLTYLLSALKVFGPAYSQQARHERLVKGFHGFHLYADRYWVEYLLFLGESPHLESGSLPARFWALISQLSEVLGPLSSFSAEPKDDGEFVPRIDGLQFLKSWRGLHREATSVLKDQSLRSIKDGIERDNASRDCRGNSPAATFMPVISFKSALGNFQKTVRWLLTAHDVAGVSFKDLQHFRNAFRTSAYTCSLKACPRVGLGFESEKLLRDHEQSHRIQWPCDLPGCQYPPLQSARALKNHKSKCHPEASTPISISRIRSTQKPAPHSKPPARIQGGPVSSQMSRRSSLSDREAQFDNRMVTYLATNDINRRENGVSNAMSSPADLPCLTVTRDEQAPVQKKSNSNLNAGATLGAELLPPDPTYASLAAIDPDKIVRLTEA